VDVLGYQPMKIGKASAYIPSRMDVKLMPDLMRAVSQCSGRLLDPLTVASFPRSSNEPAAHLPLNRSGNPQMQEMYTKSADVRLLLFTDALSQTYMFDMHLFGRVHEALVLSPSFFDVERVGAHEE
jgi:hypothetical protein